MSRPELEIRLRRRKAGEPNFGIIEARIWQGNAPGMQLLKRRTITSMDTAEKEALAEFARSKMRHHFTARVVRDEDGQPAHNEEMTCS